MDGMPKHSKRLSGNQMRRAAMWILASGVAAIAAVVSYSHIYDLGRAHGGTGVPARLLPLSVDMLILVGELMLLHEADAKGKRFILGWVLVWSGILATLAANVAFGAQFGLVGAVIWGWPAYSFILAAAGMVSVVKRTAFMPVNAAAEAAMEDATPEATEKATPEAATEAAEDVAREAIADAIEEAVPVSPEMPPGQVPAKPPEMPAVNPPSRPVRLVKSHEAERGRAEYRKSVRQGQPLSQRALGDKFGKSRQWGADRIREVEEGPALTAQAQP